MGNGEITILIAAIAAFLLFIMPIVTLVRIMKRQDFIQPIDKIGWVLIVLLLPLVGWIVYMSNGDRKEA